MDSGVKENKEGIRCRESLSWKTIGKVAEAAVYTAQS